MTDASILLVPISLSPREGIEFLRQALEALFRVPVILTKTPGFDPEKAFDASRCQYSSSVLLSLLLEEYRDHDGNILAVTSEDLFVPVLTFVFGEAQLDGRAAVVSCHRLDEEFYGLSSDPVLHRHRLVKEAVHELGHTFGLIHCGNSNCVMYSSTAVEEIDVKPEGFCQRCAIELQKNSRGSKVPAE